MEVTKAVIPAAGLGTRLLPATKAIPKEMVPVIDKPGIQYAVEECVRAGIEDILIISGRNKASLEDHFDRAPELESQLEARGKTAELETVTSIARMASIFSVRQKEPLGFGHAVLMAREHIGDQPFVVMVPDEIVPEPLEGEAPLVTRMVEIYERYRASVVAVKEVPMEDISHYGVVRPEMVEDDVARILEFVEKPAVEDAPSNLASVGRYVLTPAIFDALANTAPGVGNEIQLTDGINAVMEAESGFAYIHSGPIFDAGKKFDLVRATIELALRRDDLAGPVREYISGLSLSSD